jgi:hypothetical protein
MGFTTAQRFQQILDLPISLAQTELRRGRFIAAGRIKLELGQVMRVRLFALHFISVLTPLVDPAVFNTALGIVSAGVYISPMICSSALLLKLSSPGIVAANSFACKDFSTPGTYVFLVANNSSNVDASVSLTGSVKVFNVA